MKHTSIYFLGIILLMSCGHPADKLTKKDSINKDSIIHSANSHFNDTLAIPEDTIPKVTIPKGTIQISKSILDTRSVAKILGVHSYNGEDSVNVGNQREVWYGLFNKNKRFYLAPTKVKFVREHSALDQNESEKTGLRVVIKNKDDNILLINGIDSLIDGPVKSALPELVTYGDYWRYTGQKFEFNYYGIAYTLYTTGIKRNGEIQNCKLFLMANVKGHNFNQVLQSHGEGIRLNGVGDSSDMIIINFAGDLDGDKIPDFIISGSGYSFEYTGLYLSKPAGDNAIVKLVAFRRVEE